MYDLDENEFGQKKRLYASTEEELKNKIAIAEEEHQQELSYHIPVGCRLQDYVKFYFKNAVGKIAAVKINHLIKLFEQAVFHTEIDKDMTEIAEQDILRFYGQLLDKFLYENVLEIDDVLRKTFDLANRTGAVAFDYSEIDVPQGKFDKGGSEYIVDEKELQNILTFCLHDNCKRYGSNELLIIFAIYTGILFSRAVRITGDDIDLENAAVITDGRKISIPDECVEWLKRMQEEGKLKLSGNDPLFKNAKGDAASYSTAIVTLSSIAKRCGMPKGINSKSLHKAYIIHQLNKGVSTEELRKRFGYKRIQSIIEIQEEYEVRRALF